MLVSPHANTPSLVALHHDVVVLQVVYTVRNFKDRTFTHRYLQLATSKHQHRTFEILMVN